MPPHNDPPVRVVGLPSYDLVLVQRKLCGHHGAHAALARCVGATFSLVSRMPWPTCNYDAPHTLPCILRVWNIQDIGVTVLHCHAKLTGHTAKRGGEETIILDL